MLNPTRMVLMKSSKIGSVDTEYTYYVYGTSSDSRGKNEYRGPCMNHTVSEYHVTVKF